MRRLFVDDLPAAFASAVITTCAARFRTFLFRARKGSGSSVDVLLHYVAGDAREGRLPASI